MFRVSEWSCSHYNWWKPSRGTSFHVMIPSLWSCGRMRWHWCVPFALLYTLLCSTFLWSLSCQNSDKVLCILLVHNAIEPAQNSWCQQYLNGRCLYIQSRYWKLSLRTIWRINFYCVWWNYQFPVLCIPDVVPPQCGTHRENNLRKCNIISLTWISKLLPVCCLDKFTPSLPLS